MPKGIDKLIICSPYEKPTKHWKYNRDKQIFELVEGRRKASFIVATPDSQSFDDPGIVKEIELVNQIRPRIEKWKENNYHGVTGVTRKLLEHWNDETQREIQFYFCQLEAIETIIWLIEAPASEKIGINVPKDGGDFIRLCNKMATGSGKTTLMAMILAWNIINKITYKKDNRFSSNALVVTPNITVKSRLSVLYQDDENNYYDKFNIVPGSLKEFLRQGKIKVMNWHVLLPLDDDTLKKGVVKKGPESDYAFVKRVLGEMSNKENIIVLNDEAHHAWRKRPELKISKEAFEERNEEEDITRWIEGLDRIHKTIGILNCFDVSATPFSPTGKKSDEEGLFGWIVSDFGLNDAIEAGLVKTPRVVFRDDGEMTKELKSIFYHLYPHVRNELQRQEETVPLPDKVRAAYNLLGKDWLDAKNDWSKNKVPVPPVFLTVCNRIETAKRIEHAFSTKKIAIEELCETDKLIRVDSKVYEKTEELLEKGAIAEGGASDSSEDDNATDTNAPKISKIEQMKQLRLKVDTVGKPGKPGADIQNVISVAMISEGWDAKNVTHILGLRAFSSQLLCEQVVGRGLRRMAHELNSDGCFDPEYVNIFGIPFTFLPYEGGDDAVPKPPKAKTLIEVVNNREDFEIKIPNIDRIDLVVKPVLILDKKEIPPVKISVKDTPTLADLASTIEGKPDYEHYITIKLQDLANSYRYQTIVFKTVSDLVDSMGNTWKGTKEEKVRSLFGFVEWFVTSKKIHIIDYLPKDDTRRRLLIALNMSKIVEHIRRYVTSANHDVFNIVFNVARPIISTADMNDWWTSKPCAITAKSQISHVVSDSTWEARVARCLEENEHVSAYVKNDHIGFNIHYMHQGQLAKYIPDFVLKLRDGLNLIIEVKGVPTEQVKSKNEYMNQWVDAVNQDGRFGKWDWEIVYDPLKINDSINKHITI